MTVMFNVCQVKNVIEQLKAPSVSIAMKILSRRSHKEESSLGLLSTSKVSVQWPLSEAAQTEGPAISPAIETEGPAISPAIETEGGAVAPIVRSQGMRPAEGKARENAGEQVSAA